MFFTLSATLGTILKGFIMAGEIGMQYEKKSFSVGMGGSSAIELTAEEKAERDRLKDERKTEEERIKKKTQEYLAHIGKQKVTRKLVPWGTKLLVKRRKVEDKSSHILLPDEIKNLPTDIADVIEVPERTMVDNEILRSTEEIIKALGAKARQGDAAASEELRNLADYLRIMTTKPGDVILMSRYGGTDFLIQETNQTLCVTDHNGIYCRVVEKKG